MNRLWRTQAETERKIDFIGKERRGNEASNGKCQDNVQGRRTCQRSWESEESDIWEDTIW